MGKIVEFEGPRSAKIYVVGEAPGATEEIEGHPFVGGAGRLLNRLLMEGGMTREECRIGNVMRTRPPSNDFSFFYSDRGKKVPKQELNEGIAYLLEDIRRTNPNVIVALGNEPLRALTGETGITNWRGSILFAKSVGCKVIPTFHPANLLRAWSNVPLVMMDFQRIREEAKNPDHKEEVCDFYIPGCNGTSRIAGYVINYCSVSLANIFYMLHEFRERKTRLTFDVETDDNLNITCIGFGWSVSEALVIPFTNSTGAPFWIQEEEELIWKAIGEVLEDETVPKVAQNAQFDITALLVNPFHIRVRGLVLDTMLAFHSLYPEIAASEKEGTTGTMKHKIGGGKKLSLLCSVFTRKPYYKHLGHSGNDRTFWTYNGLDCVGTWEVAREEEKEMVEFKVRDFYDEYVHPLIDILVDVQMRGVRIDEGVRMQAVKEYTEETARLQTLMNGAVGYEINIMSPNQLKTLLYEDLGLPPVYKKGKTRSDKPTITTNEDALQELVNKFNSPFFDLILRIRQNRKILGTYLEGNVGKDGRMRCSYVVGGTETGRLASRASVFGEGTNLQNIPHGVCRRMFIADGGKVMVAGDLSQAEARVVAYIAEEMSMIGVFERGEDIHQLSANALPDGFVPRGSTYEEVENPRRLFAKKHVHAFNYGEGAVTFARRAGIDISTATVIRDRYLNRFSGIRMWHLRIQSALGRSRTITTPLGRRRTFFGMWNEALFREAYAYVPQSTVADMTNLAMIRLREEEILLTTHDELVLQVDEGRLREAVEKMRRAFDIPLTINGRVMRIPVEIKVGKNWEEMKKMEEKENG